ncbi:MAG: UDP-N-acetylglucosamine--N-acetylmuramyl-(pentapeptide) pyrophosphoryl-undecaprenol N-acetylglucosamine transferase [Candidatus Dichloromethanomonas elyunquensis]|nr:MAG: UDP-N-acetylglucosamine--N-acetylmuramyl-(pentapeptide) pyrophosphoryl-undecaprenol N-acetylglucosamine transferase [Candidatus Dichloromethanomonas elyunquensis]
MRVIITGGGTGGHIYPAMAIAKGLVSRHLDMEVLYVGTREGMEAKLVPESGLVFKGISGKGLPRTFSINTIKTAGSNMKALWEAKQVLKEFRPDLVIGTGGYVSGPVVVTAAFFGIPTLLHEQNALPGITNKLLSRVVKGVMLTFPESEAYFPVKDKTTVVGLPVREEVGKINRKEAAAEFGLSPYQRTILVTGGSRGALSINTAWLDVLQKLNDHPDIQMIWATGSATYQHMLDEMKKKGIHREKENWRVLEYIHNIPQALACTDLCICRAGATTLAELSAAGKASILIPYPYAAENHQEYNAKAFADQGAAFMILDKELDRLILWENIERIIFNTFKLEEMSARAKTVFEPGALDRIISLCLQTAWR